MFILGLLESAYSGLPMLILREGGKERGGVGQEKMEGGEGRGKETGGKGMKGEGKGGKRRAPMTLWHGAPMS